MNSKGFTAIEEIIKDSNRIFNDYFGFVSDGKEKIDVLLEPVKFQKRLHQFIRNVYTQADKNGYERALKKVEKIVFTDSALEDIEGLGSSEWLDTIRREITALHQSTREKI